MLMVDFEGGLYMKRKLFAFFTLVPLLLFALYIPSAHGEATDGTSMIRALHAVPDAPAVDIYLDGELIAEGIHFKDASEYINVNEGNYTVEIYETGTKGENDALADTTLSIRANEVYTLIVANRIENIDVKLVENAMDVPLGQTMVRIGHLSPDTPTADFAIMNDAILFSDVSYGDITDYEILDAGEYGIQLRGENSNVDLANVELKQNNIYTVYAFNTEDDLEPIVLVDYTMLPGSLPKTGLGGTEQPAPNVLPLLIGLGSMLIWSLFTLFRRKKNA